MVGAEGNFFLKMDYLDCWKQHFLGVFFGNLVVSSQCCKKALLVLIKN